jgi:cysteinyl-tRNA synthetase
VTRGNAALASGDAAVRTALVETRAMLAVLGLDPLASEWARTESGGAAAALSALVERELVARDEARASKDWAGADAIRDRLAAAGIVVEDGADGPRWSIGPGA